MLMSKKYRPAKMVSWFAPKILFQTGIKVAISGLFGNYADKREMEAALADKATDEKELSSMAADYAQREEIWIDFVSDTGDGFNSTFSIARTIAQKQLHIEDHNGAHLLKRGKILLFGGDQIYPAPTADAYENKFRTPYETAFPLEENDHDRPHMFAIPGNHDWYDGLGNFLKVFCQQRNIGNWKTLQRRSYFALPLPYDYWIWAIDVQLDEDIDKPQLEYFRRIADNHMKQNDKIILLTAEPAWIYHELYKSDKSFNRFNFFVENYITGTVDRPLAKSFCLSVVLTGDLHHYSHYESLSGEAFCKHFIGSGGGGAFLHLTHNLPSELSTLKGAAKLKRCFPDAKTSYTLLHGVLLFFWKNPLFSALLSVVYCLLLWFLQSAQPNYMQTLSRVSFSGFLSVTGRAVLATPFVFLLCTLIVAGFYNFTDKKRGMQRVKWFGLVHGVLQCLLPFLSFWFVARTYYPVLMEEVLKVYWWPIFALIIAVTGFIQGGIFMGLYLYISNLVFNNHIDEASSALACEDYKNFLRVRIDKDGMCIYPVGIKKVTKSWKQQCVQGKLIIEGELPECHLIEAPIVIKNK